MKAELDASKWYSFIRRFKSFQKGREKRIAAGLSDSAELVLRRAKSHYLTGAALHVQTGRLRSSVAKRPTTGAKKVGKSFEVDVGTNVWYGRAWELGYFPEMVFHRTSKKGKKFEVHMPERRVKPRKWLEPAIKDNISNIERILTKAGVVFE